MVVFHCYLCLPGGNSYRQKKATPPKKKTHTPHTFLDYWSVSPGKIHFTNQNMKSLVEIGGFIPSINQPRFLGFVFMAAEEKGRGNLEDMWGNKN